MSDATWFKLKEYFPAAPEFRHSQDPCYQCQVLDPLPHCTPVTVGPRRAVHAA